jgi:hypothetical protein
MKHPGAGTCEIYVSNRALKVISLDNKYEIIALAPDWKVTTYNTITKLICEMPLKQWLMFIGALSDGWSIVTTQDTVQDKVSLAGLPARVLTTPLKGRNLGWPDTFNTQSYVKEEAFYYAGRAIPHEAALILNQLFDQESASELVLGLTLVRKDGTRFKQIWTDKSSAIELPPKFFEAPEGMRKADLGQVVGNVVAKPSEIREMIDGMGLGNDFGKRLHKDGSAKPKLP